MSGQQEASAPGQQELAKEVRELRARVAAYESSRWWRLHPRSAVSRLRGERVSSANAAAPQPSFPLDFTDADRQLCLKVAPYTMTTPPRVYALARAVEYAVGSRVPGAIVECGVWRGGSMMAVALTLLRLGETDRELWLYDTYAGMTEPTPEDVLHTGDAAEAPRSWEPAGLEDVREAVLGTGYPADRTHFVVGPVEHTVPDSAPDEIALLRLDTDWYASTKHELIHLYPRLTERGVLLVDDYGYWKGQQQAVDEYFAENGISLLLNRIDHSARIAVKA